MADNDKTIGGRNARGKRDPHATGKASRPGDEHATAKGVRGNASHSTAKARPFEQRGNQVHKNLSENASSSTGMEWPEEFVLDGKKYHNEGILSDTSGEAIVFTVSRSGKKFALKVYYYDPEHRPNHAVLEKIRKLGGNGLLVNIVSHGEWANPSGNGQVLDYELMDYCEGGSLDGEILKGDERRLNEVAIRMASAIDFLAKHGILHRDIKPSNFFYADKERTRIVLADFGISVECPEGGFVKINEMRSPVYAAPEFYTNVPGEPAEVGVESDYFSLGVSLLCLWMGKEQLTANETKLLRFKLNETLPMPTDLSPHMTSLIKSLTRLKMSDRANFDDIRRWARGEVLHVGDDLHADFYVVFNSGKNQVAHSPAELAQLLLDDTKLGIKYLYSGRVTRWLEETGMNEVAVIVEEIVEDIYPTDEAAGLMSVAYLLDPSMPYIDPTGERLTDIRSIALQLMEAPGTMAPEVIEPDTNLMIYLKANKLDKAVATILDYVASDDFVFDAETPNVNNYIACVYLALLLDPTLPILMSTEEGWAKVNDVEEMMRLFRDEGDIDFINKGILCSPALIVWLSARNPALAGKVRMLHDNAIMYDTSSIYYAADFPYRIAYEMAPEADLHFETDVNAPNRTYTVKEVGEYLNSMLNKLATGNEDAEFFEDTFVRMDSGVVGQYLRARGEEYAKYLDWNRYCMNVNDEENQSKAGPYDEVIGAYRSVAGFLGRTPSYQIEDYVFDSLEGMSQVHKAELVDSLGGWERQMPDGEGFAVPWLDAWLTTLYQENPKLDLSQKFTYEKKTAEYVEEIQKIDPKNYYAERYARALKEIDEAAETVAKNESKIKSWRWFFLLAAGIPTLIMLIVSWFIDVPAGNPISGHFWYTYIICALGAFFMFLALTRFSGAILDGAVGGFLIAGFVYAGFAWFPFVFYIIAGCVLVALAAIAVSSIFVRNKISTGGVKINADEFHFRQLDALYYAYCQPDDNLKSTVSDYARLQEQHDRKDKDNLVGTGGMWVSLVWMIFVLWFLISPQLSGRYSWGNESAIEKVVPGKWVIGKWDCRYTGGSTRIICNIDSVEDGSRIFGTMVIAGQAPVAAEGTVKSIDGNSPESFSFHVAGGDGLRQRVTALYDPETKSMKGYYYDRSQIEHGITFLSTPLETEPSADASEAMVKPTPKNATPKADSKPSPAQSPQPEAESMESAGSILPELPGWESGTPAETASGQVPEQAVPEVKEEVQESPKIPDSRATRQKLQTPNRK